MYEQILAGTRSTLYCLSWSNTIELEHLVVVLLLFNTQQLGIKILPNISSWQVHAGGPAAAGAHWHLGMEPKLHKPDASATPVHVPHWQSVVTAGRHAPEMVKLDTCNPF
jgi:hypothetical protein